MFKKLIWTIIIVVILIAIILSLNNKNVSQPNGPIKIAALLSLTGDASAYGQNAQRGIQLAVDEFNQKGGVDGRQVDMIYEDTAGDPKKTLSAYQLVTTVDHVTAVLGPLNQNELSAVIPLIDRDQMPVISPDYVPVQNRVNIHDPILVWMDAQIEAERMARYVFDQGIRKVAVIGSQDNWESTVSNGFADAFSVLGGTITDREIVLPDSADMKLPVTKALASSPEAVFIGTYYQFVNSTKTIHDLGYGGKLFGIEVDNYLAQQTAGWVENLEFIGPDYYSSAFTQDFQKRFAILPGLYAGQSYDAANILFSFLTKDATQEGIVEQMNDFKSYQGVSGSLEINADGRTTLPTALFELQNGKVSRISDLK